MAKPAKRRRARQAAKLDPGAAQDAWLLERGAEDVQRDEH